MDESLAALKLFLDELGIPAKVRRLDERKSIQKAVYLGQLSGLDLGYRHGWYVMGPYSPPLARDYYQLAEELESNEEAYGQLQLRPSAAELLKRVKPLFTIPRHTRKSLGRHDWLELLASYHYLRCVSHQDHRKATQVLEEKKSHIAPFVEDARQAFEAIGMELT